MSGRYAKGTTVSSESSRNQIEKTLSRYGATGFGYMNEGDRAMICFKIEPEDSPPRMIRITLHLPDPDDRLFTHTPSRATPRTKEAARQAWENECKSYWRALHMVILAKLEAVEIGISNFDEEFLSNLLTGSGQTVYEHVQKQLPALEAGGSMLMLPGGAG